MKVFVTGGGGFLGRVIVRQLLEAGHDVLSYSRGKYEELGLVHRQGSLSDYAALKDAMEGCEAVVHVAAKVGMWGEFEEFYEANVRGTENVLRACGELGIRYLVFTSSPSVVFSGTCEGADESLPYPDDYDAPYPHTKALSEQAVLQANGPDLCTCALRPHLVWGPGDHFIPRLFARQRKGKLRLVGDGRHLVDTIFVDNAARAHLQALDAMRQDPSSVGGKAYFLSQDQPIPIRDFINQLLAAGDLPPVTKSIPPKVALGAGHLFQSVYKLFNIKSEPPVTPFIAKQMSTAHWYDISAAKRDFGYAPEVSIEEGMRRVRDWVKQEDQF